MIHLKNYNITHYIKDLFCDFFTNLIESTKSVFYILFLSSIKAINDFNNLCTTVSCHNLVILGNGPSLISVLENSEVDFGNTDIMCVNMFCLSEYFHKIKPLHYMIVDEAFFSPIEPRTTEKVKQLITILNQVTWEMNLIISNTVAKGELLSKLNNKKLRVVRINYARTTGFKFFRHFIYRNKLGMPKTQNVLNFAICCAINMNYKRIRLYGADHSWLKDLFVDENNIVCYGDRYVYDPKLCITKIDYNLGNLLTNFSEMFKSHYLIREYADSLNIEILNCTSGSYIDAYKRY